MPAIPSVADTLKTLSLQFAVATVVARVVYVEFVALSPVFVPLEVPENVPD